MEMAKLLVKTKNPVLFNLWGGGGGRVKLTIYDAVGYSSFVNPACSRDLIMIDNLFHNMRCELFKQAKE